MNRFLNKFTIFVVPILLIIFSLEFVLLHLPNDYKYKKEYLDQHSNEIKTLILGSSHTFYGLDPKFFPMSTFNASNIISNTSLVIEKILMKYKNQLSNLNTIVLPVSYFTLFF